jgi:hypothetical protein
MRHIIVAMSFYWTVGMAEDFGGCKPGEWLPRTTVTTASLPCMPCPIGMQCPTGIEREPCPAGAVALVKGSTVCCDRTLTCPHGHAVNGSSSCACVPITCPLKKQVTLSRMQCATHCPATTMCDVVDKDCKCAQGVVCESGTWWRTDEGFTCLWIGNKKKR